MLKFEKKLVAVLNEKIESGKAMNALAHMCIGFGAALGKEPLCLTDYKDGSGNSHPNISEMPFIILKGNSNKIRNLRSIAAEKGILYTDFTDTMNCGSYEDQIKRSAETLEENLVYFGVVLFGAWDDVTEVTRKFSLWK